MLNNTKILPFNQFDLNSLSRCFLEDFMITRTKSYVLLMISDSDPLSDIYSEFYDDTCNCIQVVICGVLFHQIVGVVWQTPYLNQVLNGIATSN